jgi:hypothetical protein
MKSLGVIEKDVLKHELAAEKAVYVTFKVGCDGSELI